MKEITMKKKLIFAVFTILLAGILTVKTDASAAEAYTNAMILDITNRLLNGLPTTLNEQLAVSAPDVSLPSLGGGTGYIIFGDSRMTAMNIVCQINGTADNWFMIACAAAHLSYLPDIAIPAAGILEAAHPEISHWVYIINLGITDLDRSKAYADYLGQLSKTKDVCFLSVNPTASTNTTKTFALTNKRISAFNSVMAQIPSVRYLDSYSYLQNTGYTPSSDGFHYEADTTQKIYQFIKSCFSLCP